jgi:mRNA-degrading endonuclease RelE of RelBE toxin-antitoxin system
MDRLAKELQKLSKKELERVLIVLQKLQLGQVDSLQVKSLKGRDEVYRARVGRFRVVYSVSKEGTLNVLAVRKRDEKTYRDI